MLPLLSSAVSVSAAFFSLLSFFFPQRQGLSSANTNMENSLSEAISGQSLIHPESGQRQARMPGLLSLGHSALLAVEVTGSGCCAVLLPGSGTDPTCLQQAVAHQYPTHCFPTLLSSSLCVSVEFLENPSIQMKCTEILAQGVRWDLQYEDVLIAALMPSAVFLEDCFSMASTLGLLVDKT